MKSLFSVLFFILLLNMTSNADASIELISGHLNVGDSISINAGSVGIFTNNSLVSDAETVVQIDPTGFVISASSRYFTGGSVFGIESAGGDLQFKVLEDSVFQFDWFAEGDFSGASLGLKENNSFILRCVASGGCEHSLFHKDNGELLLPKGNYELTYLASGAGGTGGIFLDSDLNFSLQTSTVPLPTALWMFITGLAALFTRNLSK